MCSSDLPFTLPMLLISGQSDPVGGYGKGILQVYRDLKSTGHKNVKMKLYKDYRHEILNELDKEIVYQDVADWADKVTTEQS